HTAPADTNPARESVGPKNTTCSKYHDGSYVNNFTLNKLELNFMAFGTVPFFSADSEKSGQSPTVLNSFLHFGLIGNQPLSVASRHAIQNAC
ncbi:MAG TPA: hypothetical protein VGJ15_08155, partial [Pirellulales bacterium]